MSTAQPTLDDIWRLFQETDRMIKESRKDMDRMGRENGQMRQESGQIRQETEQIRRETEQIRRETEQMRQENERMRRETERMSQETERKFQEGYDKVLASIGRLGNRLGDFIEDAVRPAAVRLFRERGIDVHEVYQNVSSQRGEEGIEIDLLVVNDNEAVAIECKSHLTLDDVKEQLERLAKLKRLLPKYADSRVLGAVAAMVIPDNVAKFAYRQGLFVIGQSGEQLLIRNDAQFVPKAW